MLTTLIPAVGPLAIWLFGAIVVLLMLVAGASSRWDLERVVKILRCERGGVQSVSFVLTLPFFILVVMFIVQIGQLMIGLMVVQYAAFAAARSAQVWIPAETDAEFPRLSKNELPSQFDIRQAIPISQDTLSGSLEGKREKIFSAAVLACSPIAPSKAIGVSPASNSSGVLIGAVQKAYQRLVPTSTSNPLIPVRLANKLQYSFANTYVALNVLDRSSGPPGSFESYNPQGHPRVSYRPYEAGWQDPVTVTVMHDFWLMPGLARHLKLPLVSNNSVSALFPGPRNRNQVRLSGSTTVTIEGLKPVALPGRERVGANSTQE